MRVMARIQIPVEEGNRGIQDGTVPKLIQEMQERWQPEAAYFATFDGQRTMYVVFDMADSSVMPPFAEPFFMGLNANVVFAPVMNGDDLQKGLSQLG